MSCLQRAPCSANRYRQPVGKLPSSACSAFWHLCCTIRPLPKLSSAAEVNTKMPGDAGKGELQLPAGCHSSCRPPRHLQGLGAFPPKTASSYSRVWGRCEFSKGAVVTESAARQAVCCLSALRCSVLVCWRCAQRPSLHCWLSVIWHKHSQRAP